MKNTLIAFFILFPSILFAQNNFKSLTGIIVDAQTYEPLPFANIIVLETNFGTTTNTYGEFKIDNVSTLTQLRISYVGYTSQLVKLNEVDFSNEIYFLLQPININLQEVTVYSNSATSGSKTQLSSVSLYNKQIREISAAMPDILRSVQALPGVVVNNEFKADFNVRGGNQDENLVLVNGTQVYEPYHIKEASNASVGIFNVDLMKKVNFITGGFSAKYGDKMSSVVDIEYREGNKTNFSGAASLSLAYLDGYIEGPIADNISFIFGARKSYMEYVLSLIDYEDISSAKPSFYDIQGVLSYQVSPKNKILFEFIHAGDDFKYDPKRIYSSKTEIEKNRGNYFSSLFDIKSKNILSSKALLNFEVSYYDQIDEENRIFDREAFISNSRYDKLFTNRTTYDSLRIQTLKFNSDFNYQFNSNYEILTGISYQNINYKQDSEDIYTYIGRLKNTDPVVKDTTYRNGDFASGDPVDVNSFKYTGYLENIFSIQNNLTLNVGARFDYFDINKDFTISPRLNAAYRFENGIILKAAWGHFYQSPIYHQLAYSEASDTNTLSQKATHYILGAEKKFNLDQDNFFRLKLEGYFKKYDNLISSQFGVFERLTYSKINDAAGSSTGFDFYAVLKLNRFYGWLSYSYLDASEDKNTDNFGEYPRYTNQTHTIALVTNIYLGNNWDLSLKGYYGSGFPYTPRIAEKDEATGLWSWKSGKIHSADLPSYKRIDLRISKVFKFNNLNLSTFLDISNALNFRNVQRYDFEAPGFSKPEKEEILLWPIIPSFGIRLEF
jgi:outer membrane receptor for ferrienterochelin and colicin